MVNYLLFYLSPLPPILHLTPFLLTSSVTWLHQLASLSSVKFPSQMYYCHPQTFTLLILLSQKRERRIHLWAPISFQLLPHFFFPLWNKIPWNCGPYLPSTTSFVLSSGKPRHQDSAPSFHRSCSYQGHRETQYSSLSSYLICPDRDSCLLLSIHNITYMHSSPSEPLFGNFYPFFYVLDLLTLLIDCLLHEGPEFDCFVLYCIPSTQNSVLYSVGI